MAQQRKLPVRWWGWNAGQMGPGWWLQDGTVRRKGSGCGGYGRDALEERRHLPFQVLDASAIEGIRGLAGESSSIYSCIQIYKALTPPAPPAYRGATEGPGPPSYVGSSEERPCPELGLCAPPSAPAGAGAAVGGWAPPPPDDCRREEGRWRGSGTQMVVHQKWPK